MGFPEEDGLFPGPWEFEQDIDLPDAILYPGWADSYVYDMGWSEDAEGHSLWNHVQIGTDPDAGGWGMLVEADGAIETWYRPDLTGPDGFGECYSQLYSVYRDRTAGIRDRDGSAVTLAELKRRGAIEPARNGIETMRGADGPARERPPARPMQPSAPGRGARAL